MYVDSHPLLAELESALIEALRQQLHSTLLIWGESANLTDHVTRKLNLDTQFLPGHSFISTVRVCTVWQGHSSSTNRTHWQCDSPTVPALVW